MENPAERGSLKRFVPIVIAVVGLVGAVGFYVWTSALERDQTETRFHETASHRVVAVMAGIDKAVDAVELLGAFFDAAPSVNREEFRAFVQPMFTQGLGLQAIEWIPRIPAPERAQYERRASQELGIVFGITELDSLGVSVPGRERPEYYPVSYVEPYAGNEAALGFDLNSNALRGAALARARDTGGPAATERITLVQETGGQYGYLLFLPVYEGGPSVASVDERRAALEGFVLGVFRVGDQLESVAPPLGGVDIYAFDQGAPDESSLLYPYEVPPRLDGAGAPLGLREALLSRVHFDSSFAVGDREWMVVASPQGGMLAPNDWLPITAAGGLLAFTTLLAVLLAGVQSRARDVDNLVKERTRLLSRAEARIRAIVESRSTNKA